MWILIGHCRRRRWSSVASKKVHHSVPHAMTYWSILVIPRHHWDWLINCNSWRRQALMLWLCVVAMAQQTHSINLFAIRRRSISCDDRNRKVWATIRHLLPDLEWLAMVVCGGFVNLERLGCCCCCCCRTRCAFWLMAIGTENGLFHQQ